MAESVFENATVLQEQSANHAKPWKIPLAQRARTQEKKELLAHLEEQARDIERMLFVAYPRAQKAELQEAPDQMLEKLISLAKDARGLAEQHRDFHVGGAVLGIRAVNTTADNPWVVLFDANTKPEKDSPKWCAELYLMDALEVPEKKMLKVLSFVIVAVPQMDDDSGKKQITLTPCVLCRDRMIAMSKAEQPIVALDTEVVTVDSRDTRYRKFQKVKDLHPFHGERADIDPDFE